MSLMATLSSTGGLLEWGMRARIARTTLSITVNMLDIYPHATPPHVAIEPPLRDKQTIDNLPGDASASGIRDTVTVVGFGDPEDYTDSLVAVLGGRSVCASSDKAGSGRLST